MPEIEIPDELVPKIMAGNLGILCPLDNGELKLGTTIHPYGGASRDYHCRGCGIKYTEGAVIRAALGEPQFLEQQTRKYRSESGLEASL